MIVFMECSTNNRASTVCTLFRNAVHTFGLPSRVRSDKGGENADVAWLMLSHPVPSREGGVGGVITLGPAKNSVYENISYINHALLGNFLVLA